MLKKYMVLRAPDVNTGGESSIPSEAPTTEVQDVETESSTVETDVKEPTLKEVVADVLKKHEKPTESSTEEEKSAGLKKTTTEEGKQEEKVLDKKEATSVPDEKLPFGKHPRFQELVGQKNEAERKVKEFEPIVQRMQNIEKFCEEKKITPEAYSQALALAALVNENPQDAVKKLEAVVSELKQRTGEALPADLQKRVDEGVLDVETAKEMSMLRLKVNGDKAQQERQSKQQEQQTQQQLTQSLNNWSESKKGSDPDFKPKTDANAPDGKYELVFSKFLYYWNTQPIYRVEDAVALIDKAYNDVNQSLKSFQPVPPKRHPLTSTRASTKPKEETFDVSKPGWARKVAAGIVSR